MLYQFPDSRSQFDIIQSRLICRILSGVLVKKKLKKKFFVPIRRMTFSARIFFISPFMYPLFVGIYRHTQMHGIGGERINLLLVLPSS